MTEPVRALIVGDSPLDRVRLKVQLQHARPRLIYWRGLASKDLTLEEMIEGVKNTPVESVEEEGERETVTARTLFGDDIPWYKEMAVCLQQNDPTMLDQVIEFDHMHTAFDYHKLLPLVTCPVLLIQGEPALGGMLSDAEVEQAQSLLPQIRVARLEGVGHNLYTGHNEPVLEPINAFLEDLGQ